MKQLSDFPDYKAASARLAELRTELAGVEAEREQLYVELHAKATTREDGLDAKARALLAGEPETSAEPLAAKYEAVSQRAEVLQKAIAMQTAEADRLRARYSEQINLAAEKEYFVLLREAVDSAVKQSKAFAAAMAYRDTLEQSGVIVTLPRLDVAGRYGIYDQPSAHIHTVISEAVKVGAIRQGTYPQPKPQGLYDHLPAEGVEAVSAGPQGISRVQIHRGGRLKTLETLHTTDEPATACGRAAS